MSRPRTKLDLHLLYANGDTASIETHVAAARNAGLSVTLSQNRFLYIETPPNPAYRRPRNDVLRYARKFYRRQTG